MKRFFACLLALIMALPMTACAAKATDFTDVPADADYAQAVAWCKEQGLMKGTSDTQFSPEDTLTRAMVVTVLYRRAGQPGLEDENLGYPFADVDASAWYGMAVYWARLNGIVQGYGDGRFGTEDPITLEQLDVILRRYQGEDPAWTGDPDLAVPATRALAALAFYGAFHGEPGSEPQPSDTPAPTPAPETGRVLVAYFSATGNTETVANHIKDILGEAADLYEIQPETPYTSADLNYNTDCRANREQNDDSARPAIAGGVENMEQYDVVFLGYPIWWGKAPKIIHTFLESYDFSGKTIVPFCTSGSSPYNDGTIRPLAPDADWRTGQRFGSGAARSAVDRWVDGLDLPTAAEEEEDQMYLQVGDTVWTATLEDNPSVTAWRELLAQGPLTVEMHDYGGFEKVGSIGATLTRSDRQIDTKPGDIILYQGNSVTIYYGENSWNFTPLGHVSGVPEAELRQALKAGGENVSVTFSLTAPAEL